MQQQMTTLGVKLTILQLIAEMDYEESDALEVAKELYDWVMEDVEVDNNKGEVTQLHPVQ